MDKLTSVVSQHRNGLKIDYRRRLCPVKKINVIRQAMHKIVKKIIGMPIHKTVAV